MDGLALRKAVMERWYSSKSVLTSSAGSSDSGVGQLLLQALHHVLGALHLQIADGLHAFRDVDAGQSGDDAVPSRARYGSQAQHEVLSRPAASMMLQHVLDAGRGG